MRTSNPDIFAVGDAVEVKDFVTGQWTLIPLAGPANRQGRIAADVIAGRRLPLSRHPGHLDLPDLRGCDRSDRRQREGLGATRRPGFREDLPLREFARGVLSGRQDARDQGPVPEIRRTAARSAGAGRGWRCQADRFLCHGDPGEAHHLRPGRIRAELRAALRKRQRPRQLRGNGGREYPPRRHAAHPLETRSTARFSSMCAILRNLPSKSVPGAVNIPLPQLRSRLDELPRDREILVICRSGGRAYYATRILLQNGFKARNISGGMLARSHATVWREV